MKSNKKLFSKAKEKKIFFKVFCAVLSGSGPYIVQHHQEVIDFYKDHKYKSLIDQCQDHDRMNNEDQHYKAVLIQEAIKTAKIATQIIRDVI